MSGKPCWKIWGHNATYVCVREDDHPGGCQYVYIGRDARVTEDGQVPISVNECVERSCNRRSISVSSASPCSFARGLIVADLHLCVVHNGYA